MQEKVNEMNEFDEYITGVMELKVGDKVLKLKADISDKRKLKVAYADGELTEKGLEIIDNALVGLLIKSYPDENPEGLRGFYMKHDMEFLQEFMIKVGWAKKDDFVKTEKKKSPN